MSLRAPAEVTASTWVDRDGIAAIWGLHLSAAGAYRDGRKVVAALIIEIADAAEQEWLRRKGDAGAQWLAELASLIPRLNRRTPSPRSAGQDRRQSCSSAARAAPFCRYDRVQSS
jgi:hypothetical protein